MERTKPENGHYYHVYNRGVEKRNIFLDDSDYYRFLLGLREYNDVHSTQNILRRLLEGSRTSFKKEEDSLVEIVCYCLMKNHYHLLLRQLRDDGIPRFMQKIGTGYTHYFNEKHLRSGVLFQGKYKHVQIVTDGQLRYVKQYIHLNPLDLYQPNWKDVGVSDPTEALLYLKHYRWSDCENYEEYLETIREWEPRRFGAAEHLMLDYNLKEVGLPSD